MKYIKFGVIILLLLLFYRPTPIYSQPNLTANSYIFNISHNNGTVHMDYDNISEIITFSYGNLSIISYPSVTGKVISGLNFQYLKSVPFKLRRISPTEWNVSFVNYQRNGYFNSTYTIQFQGFDQNLEVATLEYKLIILFNNDTEAPKISFYEHNTHTLKSNYNNPNQTFDIIIHDNRYLGNVALYTDNTINRPFTFESLSPYNETFSGPDYYSFFSNITTTIISNVTISKSSLILKEGNFSISMIASDLAGNTISKIFFYEYFDFKPPDISFNYDQNKIFEPNNITVAWNFYDDHPETPQKFGIEIDTNGDGQVDTLLSDNITGTSFSFALPSRWSLPKLTIADKNDGYVINEIRIYAYDKYGNFNDALSVFKIDIKNFIGNTTNSNILSNISNNPISNKGNSKSNGGPNFWLIGGILIIMVAIVTNPSKILKMKFKTSSKNVLDKPIQKNYQKFKNRMKKKYK